MARDELDSLLLELKKDIKKVVLTDCVNKIKDIHQEVIEEVVYNSYEPTYYDRRRDDNGLADRDNMQFDYVDSRNEMVISMQNVTKGNGAYSGAMGYTSGYIADIIEDGIGYGYGLDDTIGARPFQEETQDRIDSTTEADDSIESGLRKLGYDFE